MNKEVTYIEVVNNTVFIILFFNFFIFCQPSCLLFFKVSIPEQRY